MCCRLRRHEQQAKASSWMLDYPHLSNPMPAYDLTYINTPDRAHRRLLEETSPGHYSLCIDNTTLEKLLTCPRAFEQYAVLGRDVGERDALNYGSALHEALEVFYKGGTLEQMITALHEAFTKKPTAPESWRNFDHALESVKRYYNWRQQMTLCPWVPIQIKQPVIKMSGNGPRDFIETTALSPAVEIPFKIELFKKVSGEMAVSYPPELVAQNTLVDSKTLLSGKTGFVYNSLIVYWTGKIDLIIEQDGQPWPIDHKTTSVEGPTFWEQFRLSSQMMGYCWATQKLLGRTVPGVIIDMLYGRPYTKSGTSHDNKSQAFEYSAEQLAAWEKDTKNHIERILHYLFEGYFPKSTAWCVNKFGKCPYFDVCTMSQRAAPGLLMSGQFTERTWNPLTA